jgi:hypothetical protein
MPITPPACLDGQTNGKLDASLLVATPGLAGGPTVRLVEPAARAWRALTAAAAAAGHTLKVTSSADSYRTYAQQVATFTSRYQLDPIPDRPFRLWDSDNSGTPEKWWQKPNTAPAAVPGTSNHGWGLAVDTGEERDGDTGTESIDQATLNWLVAHELAYGFSHELQVEPWHIRYWAGDAIPAAVLDYEMGVIMALSPEDIKAIWEADIIPSGDPANPAWVVKSFLAGVYKQQLATDAKVTALAVKQDQILAALAALPGGGAGPSLDQIETVVRDAVADGLEGGSAQVRADE